MRFLGSAPGRPDSALSRPGFRLQSVAAPADAFRVFLSWKGIHQEADVGVNPNGNDNERGDAGKEAGRAAGTPRAPRRTVLLEADEHSGVTRVLAEYDGADLSGNRIHQDVQRLATEHPGRHVAVEWLGPLGWTRFLWCRKSVTDAGQG
jgi:hypothetical protein